MPKNVPSLKPKQLIKILENGGCAFYREGKGDHRLYTRQVEGQRRVVKIDMGASGNVSCLCFKNFQAVWIY